MRGTGLRLRTGLLFVCGLFADRFFTHVFVASRSAYDRFIADFFFGNRFVLVREARISGRAVLWHFARGGDFLAFGGYDDVADSVFVVGVIEWAVLQVDGALVQQAGEDVG